jgi:hypothetical protein
LAIDEGEGRKREEKGQTLFKEGSFFAVVASSSLSLFIIIRSLSQKSLSAVGVEGEIVVV